MTFLGATLQNWIDFVQGVVLLILAVNVLVLIKRAQ